MKTFSAKSQEIRRNWIQINLEGKVLGRAASKVAHILKGKHKPEYTPHVDTGDNVIVTNVDKIIVTGNKAKDKLYYRHSGYPGGLQSEAYEKLHARQPERVFEKAVRGMLPKNALGRAMLKKLKVYRGSEHIHAAQQPQLLEI